jgi:hypothetical protein
MCAFGILAVALSFLTIGEHQSMERGSQAVDLRDMRVMADTVFRRIVYEYWKWNDGDRGPGDQWYADFAGMRGTQKERWKVYSLVLRKRKGMVAGVDPSGRVGGLFEEEDYYDRDRYGESASSTSGSGGTSSSGSGSTSGSGSAADASNDAASGEPAYRIELEVYLQDRDEPEMVLSSIVPVPANERDEETSK